MTEPHTDFRKVRRFVRDQGRSLKDLARIQQEADARLAELEAKAAANTLEAEATTRGLRPEQLDYLRRLNPELTSEGLAEAADKFGVRPVTGFVPSAGGSSVPPRPFSQDDVDAALRRDDRAALARIAEAAVKDPRRLSLKWQHMMED